MGNDRGQKKKQTARACTGGLAPRKMLPNAYRAYFYKVSGGALKETNSQTYESKSDAQTQTTISGECKEAKETSTTQSQTALTIRNPDAYQDSD